MIGGCNWDKIGIVDKKSNQLIWTHQLEKGDDCNDLEVTKSGNILMAYKGGARMITRDHKVLWDFKVEPKQELYTATELKNGNILLAVCANPSRIITLNGNGEKLNEQNFNSGIEHVHGQFRQILLTSSDTYLIPLMGKGEVIELDKNSVVKKQVKVGGNPFSVKILQDGKWLVACGDAHRLVTVDPQKAMVVDSVGNSMVKPVSLLFVAESSPGLKGTTYIANWNGHSKDKTQPKIIEIDKNKKVIWSLAQNDQIANVSALYSFMEK